MSITTNNYIDKDEFLKILQEYQEKCARYKEEGKPQPPIPDRIGIAFLEMAKRIASRPNWRDYSWIDEMRDDAIVACCAAVHSFDPSNSKKNPFGYFSKIIWNEFIQRWRKEKKETYIKYKSYEAYAIECSLQDHPVDLSLTMDLDNEKMEKIVEQFEKKPKKKTKKKPVGVERFIGVEEPK